MSEYDKVETQYKDADCLRKALQTVSEKLGIEFEEGENIHLVGYQGKTRQQTAQFVIRRRYVGGSANDLGFARQADGSYTLIISEFDRHRRDKLLTPIKRQYARAGLEKMAEEQGMEIYEERDEAGELVGRIRPKRRKAKKVVRGKRRRLRIGIGRN